MEVVIVWVRDIACIYLLFSLIGNILPESEEKKYVQYFGNILITICLLRPLLQWENFGETLEKNVISNVLESVYEEIQQETGKANLVGISYIEDACREQLQMQMEEWVQVYGYELILCNVEFSEGESMELESLRMRVRAKKEQEESRHKQEEFLKNELSNVYRIPEENIHISIQG